MKNYETLRVEQKGDVVTACLNRPVSGNAINVQMVNDLTDVLKIVEETKNVSVFVIRGSDEVFCSGMELSDFSLEDQAEVYGLQKWEKVCRQLERLNKFTVAAVEGECIGGGVQLVLICDARIAVDTAQFRLNEVKQGYLPGMATFRLPKYIGLGQAKDIVLTGRMFSAAEAKEWGLLNQVSDEASFGQLLQDTIKAALPVNPVAVEMARRLLGECYGASYENFLGHFLAAQHRAVNSEEFQRLLSRAKRNPSGS
ncbi:MAG: enoyl-CoA hydratase/isomerase family protein [Planctomycetota bacterium]|jgi:enoyl-CoA hydratase/carnithine racemase